MAMNISNIAILVMSVLMLVSLVSSLAGEVAVAKNSPYNGTAEYGYNATNVTGASATILTLINLVFALGIVVLLIRNWIKK